MGTKLQANTFLRDYHSVSERDGNTSTGLRSLYHEKGIAKNSHNPSSLVSQLYSNGCFGHEKEKVRQTIMKQESIFRNQLQELHRLYRRQRELMNELRRTEMTKDDAKEEISKASSFSYLNNMEKQKTERFCKISGFENTSGNRNYQASYDIDAKSSQNAGQMSQCNGDAPRSGFYFKRTGDRSCLSISNGVPVNLGPSRGELSGNSRMKIFGIEISGGNNDSEHGRTNVNNGKYERAKEDSKDEISSQELFSKHFDMNGKYPQASSSVGLNSVKVHYESPESDPTFKNLDMNSKPADCQTEQENLNGRLPWFLRNSQNNSDTNKGTTGSYFMNLDSLQNCSQNFFTKTGVAESTVKPLKQKKEISAVNEVDEGKSVKKILGFPISSDMHSAKKVKTDEGVGTSKDQVFLKGLNNCISDLKPHIDLNMALDGEEVPSGPTVPNSSLKIVTTEIDLEAPAAIEPEASSIVSYEESDRIAAEAIIAISSSQGNYLVDSGACEPEKAESVDCLKWLADIVSSQSCDTYSMHDEEEFVPSGMDYFEFMTLNLEDTKEEQYHYKPVMLHNPSDDETRITKFPKRPRRGQSRRGRQRKDFQRDVLPGLVTLSRVEVTEDFQAFEEILKLQGGSEQLALPHTRHGRGRKRPGGTVVKAQCTTPKQKQPVECQHEERRLTGWGKRTRRLPRQRCANAFLSFPVKC